MEKENSLLGRTETCQAGRRGQRSLPPGGEQTNANPEGKCKPSDPGKAGPGSFQEGRNHPGAAAAAAAQPRSTQRQQKRLLARPGPAWPPTARQSRRREGPAGPPPPGSPLPAAGAVSGAGASPRPAPPLPGPAALPPAAPAPAAAAQVSAGAGVPSRGSFRGWWCPGAGPLPVACPGPHPRLRLAEGGGGGLGIGRWEQPLPAPAGAGIPGAPHRSRRLLCSGSCRQGRGRGGRRPPQRCGSAACFRISLEMQQLLKKLKEGEKKTPNRLRLLSGKSRVSPESPVLGCVRPPPLRVLQVCLSPFWGTVIPPGQTAPVSQTSRGGLGQCRRSKRYLQVQICLCMSAWGNGISKSVGNCTVSFEREHPIPSAVDGS